MSNLSHSPIQGTSCSCWELSCSSGRPSVHKLEKHVNTAALGLLFRKCWAKWLMSVLSTDAEKVLLRLAFITDASLWGLTYWKMPGNWAVGGTCSPRSLSPSSCAQSCVTPCSMRGWNPQALKRMKPTLEASALVAAQSLSLCSFFLIYLCRGRVRDCHCSCQKWLLHVEILEQTAVETRHRASL